jgi:hypothetical protein
MLNTQFVRSRGEVTGTTSGAANIPLSDYQFEKQFLIAVVRVLPVHDEFKISFVGASSHVFSHVYFLCCAEKIINIKGTLPFNQLS